VIARVLLIGAALTGCGSPPRTDAAQAVIRSPDELNVAVERRMEQLEVNLERWRWLPKDLGRRHIMVNIAAFASRSIAMSALQAPMTT